MTEKFPSVTIGYQSNSRWIAILSASRFPLLESRWPALLTARYGTDRSLWRRSHTPRALIRESSTEALREGIQPGIPVDLGRLICPGLRVIPPDLSLTHAAHRELQRQVSSFAPTWESIRPGSLFLDLTGTTRLFGPPIDTATRISRALIHHQGWHSAIGLAGNKLVSQLAATTLTKPPQLLSIHSGCEQPFLAPLPTMLLPGLHGGHPSRVLQRLEDLNLLTLGAIAAVSLVHLQAVLGTSADLLHDWALGIDPSPVHPPTAQPMIERSIHLDPDEVDDRLLLGRLYRLLEQLCTTLRQQQRVCRHISLTVRHSDHVEQTAHETLPQGTYWEVDLQPVLTRPVLPMFPSTGASHTGDASGQVGWNHRPGNFRSSTSQHPSCFPALTASRWRWIRFARNSVNRPCRGEGRYDDGAPVRASPCPFGLFADARRIVTRRTLCSRHSGKDRRPWP